MWTTIQSFALGLFIGSFLNVVIHRLPRGESVVRPRSRCPACATTIAARDNIPLLSFLLLRGRCRHCRARISARYPLVELVCGAAFAAITAAHGPTLFAALLCCFAALLLASAGIDYDEQWIPDRLSLGGLLLGLVAVPVAHALSGAHYAHALAATARGALTGAGVLWSVGFLHARLCAQLGRRFQHWPGSGGGDASSRAPFPASAFARLLVVVSRPRVGRCETARHGGRVPRRKRRVVDALRRIHRRCILRPRATARAR